MDLLSYYFYYKTTIVSLKFGFYLNLLQFDFPFGNIQNSSGQVIFSLFYFLYQEDYPLEILNKEMIIIFIIIVPL